MRRKGEPEAVNGVFAVGVRTRGSQRPKATTLLCALYVFASRRAKTRWLTLHCAASSDYRVLETRFCPLAPDRRLAHLVTRLFRLRLLRRRRLRLLRFFGQAERSQTRHLLANLPAIGQIFQHRLGALFCAFLFLETCFRSRLGLIRAGFAAYRCQYYLLLRDYPLLRGALSGTTYR